MADPANPSAVVLLLTPFNVSWGFYSDYSYERHVFDVQGSVVPVARSLEGDELG